MWSFCSANMLLLSAFLLLGTGLITVSAKPIPAPFQYVGDDRGHANIQSGFPFGPQYVGRNPPAFPFGNEELFPGGLFHGGMSGGQYVYNSASGHDSYNGGHYASGGYNGDGNFDGQYGGQNGGQNGGGRSGGGSRGSHNNKGDFTIHFSPNVNGHGQPGIHIRSNDGDVPLVNIDYKPLPHGDIENFGHLAETMQNYFNAPETDIRDINNNYYRGKGSASAHASASASASASAHGSGNDGGNSQKRGSDSEHPTTAGKTAPPSERPTTAADNTEKDRKTTTTSERPTTAADNTDKDKKTTTPSGNGNKQQPQRNGSNGGDGGASINLTFDQLAQIAQAFATGRIGNRGSSAGLNGNANGNGDANESGNDGGNQDSSRRNGGENRGDNGSDGGFGGRGGNGGDNRGFNGHANGNVGFSGNANASVSGNANASASGSGNGGDNNGGNGGDYDGGNGGDYDGGNGGDYDGGNGGDYDGGNGGRNGGRNRGRNGGGGSGDGRHIVQQVQGGLAAAGIIG